MPRHWYQKIKPKDGYELSEEDKFNNSICVDKKPCFMRYIYPDVNRQYKSYIKTSENKCLKRFGLSFDGLKSQDELTDEQAEFISNFYDNLPVNDNGCVMNRLCHMVENEFDGYTTSIKANNEFDYTILKSGNDYEYKNYLEVLKIYHEYVAKKNAICENKRMFKVSLMDFNNNKSLITEEFKEKCERICPNMVELCDIALDICYSNKNSKAFVWELFGEQIIKNLLAKNENRLKYLVRSDEGNIEFNGYKFEERILENVDNE